MELVVWSLVYLALRDALELVPLAGCRPRQLDQAGVARSRA
jgi:hypothetical protein